MAYRTVDPVYLNTNPSGQIEIAIYTKDADTLTGWVAKHSGPPTSSDMTRYWTPVTNQAASTVAGRAGLSFDWVPDTKGETIHATAVFIGVAYVLVLEWWSVDPNYEAILRPYYAQMIVDLRA